MALGHSRRLVSNCLLAERFAMFTQVNLTFTLSAFGMVLSLTLRRFK